MLNRIRATWARGHHNSAKPTPFSKKASAFSQQGYTTL